MFPCIVWWIVHSWTLRQRGQVEWLTSIRHDLLSNCSARISVANNSEYYRVTKRQALDGSCRPSRHPHLDRKLETISTINEREPTRPECTRRDRSVKSALTSLHVLRRLVPSHVDDEIRDTT